MRRLARKPTSTASASAPAFCLHLSMLCWQAASCLCCIQCSCYGCVYSTTMYATITHTAWPQLQRWPLRTAGCPSMILAFECRAANDANQDSRRQQHEGGDNDCHAGILPPQLCHHHACATTAAQGAVAGRCPRQPALFILRKAIMNDIL